MKLSINWLSKFLSLDELTPEEVANKLTMGSFEVEEIHKTGPNLKEPIVIGKILDIQKHPKADRLVVTKVTTDGKNKLQIVCGATNIKEGQMVPVSLPGAQVINRHDGTQLPIKTTKIKEIESCGMLCSPGELGIATQNPNEILILPKDAPLGQSVIDHLSLNQDTVLEIAPRSNRGDALSVYGLSKEISALTKRKLKEVVFKPPKTDNSVENVKISIENTTDTYLFYAVTIEDIEVKESPQELKELLEAVGIRSINNIVDITNYINFTYGQPMHSYDREKLKGSLISRNAKKGEKIQTIDGKLRELNEGILVIADNDGPVALAGIMGEKDSEVSENTKNIILEAAVFNPVRVRRGSRSVGLTTEASKRFERGIDSNFTYNALLSTIELIEKYASGQKNQRVGQIQQVGKTIEKQIKINLSRQEVKRNLGIEVSIKEISCHLDSLHFKVKKITEERIEVLVPPNRIIDVSRPIDLIEEVARLYGYDKIPAVPPNATLAADKSKANLGQIKAYFLTNGFSECYLSSLIGEQILSNQGFPFNEPALVKMLNPLSKEHCVLRQTLIPGLLQALKLNQGHLTTSIKLFEIGNIYFFNGINTNNKHETGVKEHLKIAGVIFANEENWFTNKNFPNTSNENLFFISKGILETFFNKCKCPVSFSNHKENFLHPNLAVKINLNNNNIGILGCIHPHTEMQLELLGPVIIFEIDLEPILNKLEKIQSFEKISSQPVVNRDITADLSKKYTADEVKTQINKVISNFVISLKLISVYELDKENRSLTYRLKMQDLEQTLTSQQIEEEVNKVKNHLIACFHAKFRV